MSRRRSLPSALTAQSSLNPHSLAKPVWTIRAIFRASGDQCASVAPARRSRRDASFDLTGDPRNEEAANAAVDDAPRVGRDGEDKGFVGRDFCDLRASVAVESDRVVLEASRVLTLVGRRLAAGAARRRSLSRSEEERRCAGESDKSQQSEHRVPHLTTVHRWGYLQHDQAALRVFEASAWPVLRTPRQQTTIAQHTRLTSAPPAPNQNITSGAARRD